MPSSCTNASSMTTSAAVRFSPLSCLKSHPPCWFFCNDEVACQSRRSRFHCRYVYASVGAENLEVDPVQAVVPSLRPHLLFPIAWPWFRPTRQLRYQLWSFRLRVSHQNRQHRDTVTCSPTHTGLKSSWLRRSGYQCQRHQYRDTAPTNDNKQVKAPNEPKMNQIMAKIVLVPTPHACAQTAVQQRMIVR